MPAFEPTVIVFYWAYLAVAAFSLIFFLMSLYHLLRFGFFSFVNVAVIFIFTFLISWLLFFSFQLLDSFDWSAPLFDDSVIGSFLGGLSGGTGWFKL